MMSIYAVVNLIQSCKINAIIFYLFKDLFAFLWVWMLFYIFVCILHMMFMYGQKEAARFLELESQMIMSHHIGAGNQIPLLQKSRDCC